MNKVKFSFSLLSLVVFTSSALSETPNRGRLEDGTPYRIDGQGMQIVDHIAELEVTVDDLRRQVTALENELAHKQRQISRISNQPRLPTTVSVEVLPRESEVQIKEANQDSVNKAELLSCEQDSSQLESTVINLRQRIEELETESELENNQRLASLQSQNQNLLTEQELMGKRLVELQSQLSIRDQRTQQLREQIQDGESLQAELISCQTDVSKLRNSLEEKRNELELAKSSSGSAKQQISEVRSRLTQSQETEASLRKEIAALNSALERYEREYVARARVKSEARFASPVSELSGQLASIDQLIRKRKKLFDQLRSAKQGVKVSMSILRTRDGESLDRLRLATKRGGLVSEASLGSGLEEIKSLLEEDIKLAKRLSKM